MPAYVQRLVSETLLATVAMPYTRLKQQTNYHGDMHPKLAAAWRLARCALTEASMWCASLRSSQAAARASLAARLWDSISDAGMLPDATKVP